MREAGVDAALVLVALSGKARLYAGPFIPKLDPQEVQEVVPQAVAAGADGVSLLTTQQGIDMSCPLSSASRRGAANTS